MFPFNITFQAYIPKNSGKPLLHYFANDPRFRPDRMTNYEEFRRELTRLDVTRHHWLPEPLYNSLYDTYCSIDDGIFHSKGNGKHPNHSTRLRFDLRIDPRKIGNYFFEPKMWYLPHQAHADGKAGMLHSDESHQVQAYIRPASGHIVTPRSGPVALKYEGVCGSVQAKRSTENPIQVTVWDKMSDSCGYRKPSTKNDTTLFQIKSSAGYPLRTIVRPIDWDFTICVQLAERSNTAYIDVKGKHDKFPAYELLVDDTIIYTHAPTSLGFAGLDMTQYFQASYSKRVHRWGIHAF